MNNHKFEIHPEYDQLNTGEVLGEISGVGRIYPMIKKPEYMPTAEDFCRGTTFKETINRMVNMPV